MKGLIDSIPKAALTTTEEFSDFDVGVEMDTIWNNRPVGHFHRAILEWLDRSITCGLD